LIADADLRLHPDRSQSIVGRWRSSTRSLELRTLTLGRSAPGSVTNGRYYNRTEYSGLETDILNSYTNALLQALHYSAPVRAVAKAHICVECKKEHCLLCEAGFLFRMLEDARGTNCQANNFSRAFSATPQGKSALVLD
jgi:hypothetical protein